jgi:Na+/H+ antiporter NhaD/arsenite permease-like protein
LVSTDWWGRHYAKVAAVLASVTLGYYLFGLGHPRRVLQTAHEYVSFIVLIGALFVIAGGIHLTVKGEATPRANVVFLLIGAVVANLLGTTGASMLLIRPWLRMNKYRLTGHHVVFFILLVSNVGGCLTPVGDPPLFLGYLKGIPFWWVAAHCWPMWAVGVGTLLLMFYLVDRHNYRRAPADVRARMAEPPDRWRIAGLGNAVFLAVVLAAVFVKQPPFLREGIMVLAALGSWCTTRRALHEANHFSFHPLREVAVLFAGIFATMMPALDWLQLNAASFGTPSPGLFFWLSGWLSSVLDNAPTYLAFLSAAAGTHVTPEVIDQVRQGLVHGAGAIPAGNGPQADLVRGALAVLSGSGGPAAAAKLPADLIGVACLLGAPALNQLIVAVSVGAVFFGATTYIGNGPNFMVKAIAEQHHAHVPSFVGYLVRYTLPFMVPMLLLVWWLFFRGS